MLEEVVIASFELFHINFMAILITIIIYVALVWSFLARQFERYVMSGNTGWCNYNSSGDQLSKFVNSYCRIIWHFFSCYRRSSAVNVTGEHTNSHIGHISETRYVSAVEKRNCRVPNNRTCDQSVVEKKKLINMKNAELIKVTWKNTWKREELM